MSADRANVQTLESGDEQMPRFWSRRGVPAARVVVLADSAGTLRALIGWASTSSHDSVLAVQLLEAAPAGGAEAVAAVPPRAGDVPLVVTRSVDRSIAPSIRALAVDLLITCTRRVLPAHVVQSPRRGSLELQRSPLPAQQDRCEWVLRSLTDRRSAASALSREVGPCPDSAHGTGVVPRRDEAFTFVLDDGVQRWLAGSGVPG